MLYLLSCSGKEKIQKMKQKFNKAEAGYHMLQLLSAVDGKFGPQEDLVITNYLVENYPFRVEMDGAMEELSKLKSEDYILHFQKCMDDFFQDSEEHERTRFLKFAVELVKADEEVTTHENIFLKVLFDSWDSAYSE